jgi:hypothetical protein
LQSAFCVIFVTVNLMKKKTRPASDAARYGAGLHHWPESIQPDLVTHPCGQIIALHEKLQVMHRRPLLKLGTISAVLLAAVGGTAAWIRPGLIQGTLTETGRQMFRAAGLCGAARHHGGGLLFCVRRLAPAGFPWACGDLKAGLEGVIVEEGSLKSSSDFNQPGRHPARWRTLAD